MALSQRVFSDALRDMQRAMAVFDHPFFNPARSSWLSNGPAALASNLGDDFNQLASASTSRFPVTDLKETSSTYELVAELPGYDKKDIKIEMADSRTLVLSGSKNEEHEARSAEPAQETVDEQEGGKHAEGASSTEQQLTKTEAAGEIAKKTDNGHTWWVRERVSGSFTRSFAFPTPVTPEDIKASFDNGLLKVTIPKVSKEQPKQINID